MKLRDIHIGPATILLGDAAASLRGLPANSVDVIMTSPPFFRLRSYLKPGDPAKAHEIGSEDAPEAFFARLMLVFDECQRVLKPTGTLLVEFGDSYSAQGGRHDGRDDNQLGVGGKRSHDALCGDAGTRTAPNGYTPGELMNIPHRFAECLRGRGWRWRSTCIWVHRCLSGGTWLYARTQKGDAPAMLKDLVRLDPATVQLWNGTQWTQVKGWARNDTARGSRRKGSGRDGYIELSLRSGERISCTSDHRWPTTRGLVLAGDLRMGDTLLSAKLPGPENPRPLCLSDEELGWMCGFYLAEGFSIRGGIAFATHRKESAAAERINRIVEQLAGTTSVQFVKGTNSARVMVYSLAVRAIMQDFIPGDSCRTKRLGRKAWMRGNGFLRALLDGYLEGDGHNRPDTAEWRIGFCNNDGLATDLRTLCARLGVSIHLRRAFGRIGDKKYPSWRGSIRFGNDRKCPDTQIKSIGHARAREFWDIEVADEPHLFALASGILTHNSVMPESVNGWRWEKCRVEVAGHKQKSGQANAMDAPNLGNEAYRPDKQAVWADCPGCPKCSATNGLVLRRGQWRCTTGHSYVFMFARTDEYFADATAAQEPASTNPITVGRNGRADKGLVGTQDGFGTWGQSGNGGYVRMDGSTRNPRTVWLDITNEPMDMAACLQCGRVWKTAEKKRELRKVKRKREDGKTEKVWQCTCGGSEWSSHYASFPSSLVRKAITPFISKAGCCEKCGVPWSPVVETARQPRGDKVGDRGGNGHGQGEEAFMEARTHVSGYLPSCSCNAAAVPQTVLDCFGGTGTVAVVAVGMGLKAILCELNVNYMPLIDRRLKEVLVPRGQAPADNPDTPLFQGAAQ